MKKFNSFFSSIKLTQDLAGFALFENFLVTAVLTVLTVRFFLQVSGYPQIGGAGLHIAHMLWGGLFLLICVLVNFLFLDRRVKQFCAIVGGIGFGLFIDELGKFITSDNNYFFQPTVALIYIFCVLLFLLMHVLKSQMKITPDEYISNVLDLFRNSLIHGVTVFERDQIALYLKEAQAKFDLADLYVATGEKPFDRKNTLVFLPKIRANLSMLISMLVGNRIFQIVIITLIEFQAIFSFFFLIFVILVVSGVLPEAIRENVVLELDFASSAALVSSFAAGLLAFAAAVYYPKNKQKAFTMIKYCLFVSIFIVQFFIFWIDQFGALVGLVFNILALETVNVVLEKRKLD